MGDEGVSGTRIQRGYGTSPLMRDYPQLYLSIQEFIERREEPVG